MILRLDQMSKKRPRHVAFSDEVTVVTAVSYPVEGNTGDPEPKHQRLEIEPDLVVSGDTAYEESLSLNPQKTDYKPGARLREQLESDSEPDDDFILYGKVKSANQPSGPLTEGNGLSKEGLDEEDLFAQERGTLQFDGNIKVTPFNMDEEMEEGRFDSEGNYYSFKEEEVTDNWLTDIDWSNVDEQGEMLSESKRGSVKEDWRNFLLTKEKLRDNSKSETEILTKFDCLSRIVSLLNPRETVAQALKRLCPSRGKETPRIKEQDLNMSIDEFKGESKVGSEFAELTELADLMCYHRDYGIYSDSLERLQAKLASHKQAQSPDLPGLKCDVSSEVSWEYKADEREGSRVYGPFRSTQMLEWSSGGFFGEGVMVRRIDKRDGPFYNSKRIDFDLYT